MTFFVQRLTGLARIISMMLVVALMEDLRALGIGVRCCIPNRTSLFSGSQGLLVLTEILNEFDTRLRVKGFWNDITAVVCGLNAIGVVMLWNTPDVSALGYKLKLDGSFTFPKLY
mmetsp:Transcript_24073/g.37141  ORF Transcript_24073/g.37141 Transcript_24073/m.37141 type:complete len:115 (-) Transcript_24073:37-381(-)